MTNLRHEFEGIKFPLVRPADWPFETWVSCEEWEVAYSPAAWIGFFFADIRFKSHIDNSDYPFNEAIFGFVDDAASPARVVLKDSKLFVCIDRRTQAMCMIAAAGQEWQLSASLLAISGHGDLLQEFIRAIDTSNEQLTIRMRGAGLLMNFLIEHELSHARSGHFQLVKARVRSAEMTRAMELAADRSAFNELLFPLLHPVLQQSASIDDLEKFAESFGYALTIFFLARAQKDPQPGSKYPTFYERVSVIAGACLVPCRASRNWAEAALIHAQARTIVGMKRAISHLAVEGIITLPESYQALSRHIAPQRANCVSCSTFARAMAEETKRSMNEVLAMADDLESFTLSRLGFNRMDYDHQRLTPHGLGYCQMDRPIRHKLEPIAKWFRTKLKR